jgi:hypothetical protein
MHHLLFFAKFFLIARKLRIIFTNLHHKKYNEGRGRFEGNLEKVETWRGNEREKGKDCEKRLKGRRLWGDREKERRERGREVSRGKR